MTCCLEIRKVLNNNSVLVGQGMKDYIWVGTGIGFRKKPGQEADDSKIERVFILQKQSTERLMNLLQEIPVTYAALADDIIQYAKKELAYAFSDAIYISLTDHIYNTIRLQKEGVVLKHYLFWEIRKFYPTEFAVGEKAVELINQKFGVVLDECEGSYIAMHFINAQLNSAKCVDNIEDMTEKIKDIISIIRLHNQVEIDENSLAFERFVTHLRFFFKRLEKRPPTNGSHSLLPHVINKYPIAYETAKLIEQYLGQAFSEEEQLYITLHIQKILEN